MRSGGLMTMVVLAAVRLSVALECPAVVKQDALVKKASELQWNGYVAYSGEGKKLTITPIKSYDPKEVKDANGNALVDVGRLQVSPDGKWLFGGVKLAKSDAVGNDRELILVKRDGSVVKRLGINCFLCAWYYKSPKENPGKGIYEMSYTPKVKTATGSFRAWDVYALTVDLSGTVPVAGEARQIAAMGTTDGNANNGEFAVAGDMMLWDVSRPGGKPTMNVTIPEGGLGMATPANIYDVREGSNCASWLNMTGDKWAANGSGDNACMPYNHISMFVLKTKHNTESKVRFYDWLYKPENGAISVNWVPESVDGIASRNKDLIDWFGWKFANNDEYVVGYNTPRQTGAVIPYGAFILHWPTNNWYQVMPTGKIATDAAMWFDGYAATTSTAPASRAMATSARRGDQALSAWHDLLGRGGFAGAAGSRSAVMHVGVNGAGAKVRR